MELVNFSIEEFLGIVLIFPLLIYLIYVIFDGIGIFKDFFDTDTGEEVFHHHFHYKDRR